MVKSNVEHMEEGESSNRIDRGNGIVVSIITNNKCDIIYRYNSNLVNMSNQNLSKKIYKDRGKHDVDFDIGSKENNDLDRRAALNGLH